MSRTREGKRETKERERERERRRNEREGRERKRETRNEGWVGGVDTAGGDLGGMLVWRERVNVGEVGGRAVGISGWHTI